MLPELIPDFGLCDKIPGGGAVDVGCDLATGGIGGATAGVLESWAADFAAATIWLLNKFIAAILTVTDPGVDESWFRLVYDRMWMPVSLFAVVIVIIGAGVAAVRGRGTDLARLVVMTPVTAVAVGVAPWVIQGLSDVVDVMSAHVASAVRADAATGLADVNRALAKTAALAPGMPFMLAFILTLFMFIGALAVGFFLLLREVGIDVIALLMPVLMLGLLTDHLKGFTSKAVSALIMLILSKFFFVAVLSLAMSGLAHTPAGPAAAAGTLLAASVTLLIAVFIPSALWRWLPDIDGLSMTARPGEVARATGVPRAASASQLAARNALQRNRMRSEAARNERAKDAKYAMREHAKDVKYAARESARDAKYEARAGGPAAAAVVGAQAVKKTTQAARSHVENTQKGSS